MGSHLYRNCFFVFVITGAADIGVLGEVGLWVGNNYYNQIFSFLYIAACHMAHVHYFSCVCLYIYILLSYLYYLNMLP